MSIAQTYLAEFEAELATTRRFLERIPTDRLSWRPHEKSMTMGELALHIAQVPYGVLHMATLDEAPVPDFSNGREAATSTAGLLKVLDDSATYVRKTLPSLDDRKMMASIRITGGGRVLMDLPRATFLRSIMFNHWYHHRGQLGVYLRLVGEKVPSSYGPSGDESHG